MVRIVGISATLILDKGKASGLLEPVGCNIGAFELTVGLTRSAARECRNGLVGHILRELERVGRKRVFARGVEEEDGRITEW